MSKYRIDMVGVTIMRNRLWLCLIVIGCIHLQSCESGDDEEDLGNWSLVGYFEGQPRSGSVSFVINDRPYVGLGYDGDDYFTDFYYYNADQGLWVQVAPFPGVGRERAVAFAIGNKAYVGTGYNRDLDIEELRDFYEYDPETNAWVRISDFAGTARYSSVGFGLNNLGYLGTGYDGNFYRSDFWQYDPDTDIWLEVASFPGGKREEALAVVIGSNVYFCTGRNNGIYTADIWKFDPGNNRWTDLTPDDDEDYYDDFTAAVRRHDATGFSISGKLFVGTGIAGNGSLDNTFYEFEPVSGEWTKRTSFEGSDRSLAVSFTVNNRAFVTTGQNSSRRWDDVWEFKPDEEYDEDN
jgi:N-acetylneuraminic acid mutarotase